MYFYRLIPQNCNFSKAQHTLPEDGPIGPKHVAENMRYFNIFEHKNDPCFLSSAQKCWLENSMLKFYVLLVNKGTGTIM